MAQMKLKIIGDGTVAGTQVIDMDSGAMLPCSAISWEFGPTDMRKATTAKLTVHIAAIEIEQDGEIVLEPVKMRAPSLSRESTGVPLLDALDEMIGV